ASGGASGRTRPRPLRSTQTTLDSFPKPATTDSCAASARSHVRPVTERSALPKTLRANEPTITVIRGLRRVRDRNLQRRDMNCPARLLETSLAFLFVFIRVHSWLKFAGAQRTKPVFRSDSYRAIGDFYADWSSGK